MALQVRVRYSSRLLPVTHTCFASLEAITELAKTVAREFFPDGEFRAVVWISVFAVLGAAGS